MANHRRNIPLPLFLGSFILAFVLMAISLPEWLRFIRPNFIALLLIYWLMRIPESIGIGFAWTAGFLFDGVSGGLLGQHALSFSFIAYLVLGLHQRARMFGIAQQAILVFLLLVLDQIIASWVAVVIRGNDFNFYYALNALAGGFCWPLVSVWLGRYQRQFFSIA